VLCRWLSEFVSLQDFERGGKKGKSVLLPLIISILDRLSSKKRGKRLGKAHLLRKAILRGRPAHISGHAREASERIARQAYARRQFECNAAGKREGSQHMSRGSDETRVEEEKKEERTLRLDGLDLDLRKGGGEHRQDRAPKRGR